MEMVLVGLFAMGVLGAIIGSTRSAPVAGFVMGFMLGPLGLLLTLLIDLRECCPECHGRLNGKPRRCQHCGVSLVTAPPTAPAGRACVVCHTTIPADAPADKFKRWCSSCTDFVGTIPLNEAYRNADG